MPIEFDKLGNELLAALSEPDGQKRKTLIKRWKDESLTTIQASLPGQLDEIVQTLTEVADKPEGWKPSDKWRQVSYNLSMNLYLQSTGRELSQVSSQVGEPETESASSGFIGGVKPGPSSNDQRSDTLNPNNPAHSAAADNRSNQMNPNNSAYGSSRR